jgi:hypothetical protein
MQPGDITLEKGLPSNLDAERFVLSILLDDSRSSAGMLSAADFSLRRTAASSGG